MINTFSILEFALFVRMGWGGVFRGWRKRRSFSLCPIFGEFFEVEDRDR